jgi:hypothetical protein
MAGILNHRGISEPETILATLDSALKWGQPGGRVAELDVSDNADSTREERALSGARRRQTISPCDWAIAKAKIRTQVGDIPFLNWFDAAQLERQGSEITIALSDEPSRIYLETEYGTLTRTVLTELGVHKIHLTVAEPASRHNETAKGIKVAREAFITSTTSLRLLDEKAIAPSFPWHINWQHYFGDTREKAKVPPSTDHHG